MISPGPYSRAGCGHGARWMIPLWIVLLFLALQPAYAQRDLPILSYPDRLYSGMNVITLSARHGLKSIQLARPDGFTLFRTGIETDGYRVISGPSFAQCAPNVTFAVYVKTISRPVSIRLRIADCSDNIRYVTYTLDETWNVSDEDFGAMRPWEKRCHTFSVSSRGGSFVIDSIASPSRDFTILYEEERPPFRISGFSLYQYSVCFTAKRVGAIRMPILVYIRRSQPSGRYTNFIVADTALVTVLPPVLAQRPKARPSPASPAIQPREIVEHPAEIAAVPLDSLPSREIPPAPSDPMPGGDLVPVTADEWLTDPTPHRTILTPNARPIDRDRIVLADYDLAGWMIGAGVTERLTLLGGLLYIPRPITAMLAATAGVKYEWYERGALRSAAGVHLNFVQTDISVVRLLFIYNAVSYGDDDHRATVSIGYSWRSHSPRDGATYDRQALALGLGGDHRFARHWKVAAELMLVEDAGYQPGAVVLRYFTERLAVDVGVGVALRVDGGDASPVIPLPVLSASWVW